MKKYRVVDIIGSFGLFIDDIVEAEDEYDAMEKVFYEIDENLGNYLDIEVEEIDDDEDDE